MTNSEYLVWFREYATTHKLYPLRPEGSQNVVYIESSKWLKYLEKSNDNH